MDNEIKEVLSLILDKLATLEKGQANLEKGQANLEKGQVGMERRLTNIERRLTNTEKRQDEIFLVVKAIESSNTTARAEIDNLTHKVAHIEGTMNAVGDLLQQRRA